MAGTKRSAPDSKEGGHNTRASKSAKTGEKSTPNKTSPKAKRGKRGPKAIPNATFKAKALPLHVNFTHTPPPIADGDKAVATEDPGFIGNATLVPTTFSTGSYGWKGSKRIVVELQNGDEKEKVHVMISINATVVGSKQAEGEGEAAADAKEEPAAEVEAEADGETAEE